MGTPQHSKGPYHSKGPPRRCDLASEHERYIAEIVFKKPTIVYNYPKDIKAFYMRLNDDGKTCAAMDVLVPRVVRTRHHAACVLQ
jgi:aspartyl/asparaginyl-tRNA synthetase